MKAKYLLPCTCGREIPVDASQAGQEVGCACGAKLEVPTMRRLTSLKRAEPETIAQPSTATWGVRHALLLVGALITAVGLVAAILHYPQRPTDFEVDNLSQLETWVLWQELRQGLNHQAPWEEPYYDGLKLYHRWLGVAGGIAVFGLLTMGRSLLIPKKRRGKSAKKRGPRPRSKGGRNRR